MRRVDLQQTSECAEKADACRSGRTPVAVRTPTCGCLTRRHITDGGKWSYSFYIVPHILILFDHFLLETFLICFNHFNSQTWTQEKSFNWFYFLLHIYCTVCTLIPKKVRSIVIILDSPAGQGTVHISSFTSEFLISVNNVKQNGNPSSSVSSTSHWATMARQDIPLFFHAFELSGHFVDLRPLGTGVTGLVLSAFDQRNGQRVAIKKLVMRDTVTVKHALREVRITHRLCHENVVQVQEVLAPYGRPLPRDPAHLSAMYIVQECMETDLARLLEQGPLPTGTQ